jgi:UPF0271 protein
MIKLNCDIGESFGIWKMGNDEKIFPLIDMANLACGFHAGDAITINNAVKLAKKYNVTIGAHISYQDLVGFGRRSMNCTTEEIQTLILYQIGALSAFCQVHNTQISYIKPHGALYNDMMQDDDIFISILKAISLYNQKFKLMILSTPFNNKYNELAKQYSIELIYEVFADRNYTNEGYLVSRNNKNAVVHNEDIILDRIKTLKEQSYLTSIDNKKLFIEANSICVHSDNDKAINFIKLLKKNL